MMELLIIIVVAVVGLCVTAGVIVLLVRLTDSSKPRPYVPHAWQTQPGWYPDPADSTVLRYYDGQAWTSSTRTRAG